ncbi:hypothetical protein C8R45DRAFT_926545 [Mycena sanguinolenta]|nr:hypothetical protein C8R45DRAFT_926545 [Mycena sanguinolenta]
MSTSPPQLLCAREAYFPELFLVLLRPSHSRFPVHSRPPQTRLARLSEEERKRGGDAQRTGNIFELWGRNERARGADGERKKMGNEGRRKERWSRKTCTRYDTNTTRDAGLGCETYHVQYDKREREHIHIHGPSSSSSIRRTTPRVNRSQAGSTSVARTEPNSGGVQTRPRPDELQDLPQKRNKGDIGFRRLGATDAQTNRSRQTWTNSARLDPSFWTICMCCGQREPDRRAMGQGKYSETSGKGVNSTDEEERSCPRIQ